MIEWQHTIVSSVINHLSTAPHRTHSMVQCFSAPENYNTFLLLYGMESFIQNYSNNRTSHSWLPIDHYREDQNALLLTLVNVLFTSVCILNMLSAGCKVGSPSKRPNQTVPHSCHRESQQTKLVFSLLFRISLIIKITWCCTY